MKKRVYITAETDNKCIYCWGKGQVKYIRGDKIEWKPCSCLIISVERRNEKRED